MRTKAGAGFGLMLIAGLAAATVERRPPPRPALAPTAPAGPRIQIGSAGPVQRVLNVRDRMSYGEFVWNENGVPTGPVHVRVDRARQLLSVFRAGHEIGTAVILYGADEKPTPPGRYPVLAKMREHRSSLYDADMPFTLRLTGDGISVHGVDVREGRATHGCIGVPNDFAQRLFDAARIGDVVEIG